MALTMPVFSSNPPCTAAATVSGGANYASAAEIIMTLDSLTKSAAVAGNRALTRLLPTIVGGWGGVGAAGSGVICSRIIGQIGTVLFFVVGVVVILRIRDRGT